MYAAGAIVSTADHWKAVCYFGGVGGSVMPHANSPWFDHRRHEFGGPLRKHTRADVCVIGAGIAGLSTAYLLAIEGRSVVLIDDGQPGRGQTGLTTAHLSNAIDDRYTEIQRLHGPAGAALACESHRAAIDSIERACNREHIDCDFRRVDGFLFLGPDHDMEFLRAEYEAARAAGADVEMLDTAPVEGFRSGPCIRFRRQAQFHPIKYMYGLALAFERAGGQLFANTRAVRISGGQGATVATEGGCEIAAGSIVVATNVPFNDRVAIHTKQAPYHTYVIAVRVEPGAITPALYWDTDDPYHYVRLHEEATGGELLIVGGEDHKAGQAADADDRYARLVRWTSERFPAAGEVEYRWSGQVMETQDGLAFIGRNPMDAENVFVATGDSGMGLTHGTIAGILLTDLIQSRQNAWTDLYDPSRVKVGAAGDFIRENLNVAAQYASWLTGGEVSSEEEIPREHGAIMRDGLSKIAVYRDAEGHLHRRSAVCPHLGCLVAWNPAAATWDCPCHGSRFDAYGKVENGPALSDLEPVVDRVMG
jgi:glycine/D-amino acid oxidase-like deaminating enzyme/nitrite reductase/ring-hydroxylating ferredoxin subunit